MRIRITKGRTDDRIEIVRGDGSRVTTRLSHKGPVPHDVTHLMVERRLGLADGFWGKLARGEHPDKLGALAKAAGHASAKRVGAVDPGFVEIVQAERLVESFEAELWSNGSDNGSVRAMAAAGCEASRVAAKAISDAAIEAIRADLCAFRETWGTMAIGDGVDLEWPEPAVGAR